MVDLPEEFNVAYKLERIFMHGCLSIYRHPWSF